MLDSHNIILSISRGGTFNDDKDIDSDSDTNELEEDEEEDENDEDNDDDEGDGDVNDNENNDSADADEMSEDKVSEVTDNEIEEDEDDDNEIEEEDDDDDRADIKDSSPEEVEDDESDDDDEIQHSMNAITARDHLANVQRSIPNENSNLNNSVMDEIVQLTYSTMESFSRLIGNVFRGESSENNEEFMDVIYKKLNRIWHGTFYTINDHENNRNGVEKMIQIDEKQLKKPTSTIIQTQGHDDDHPPIERIDDTRNHLNNVHDFGTVLLDSYHATATRHDLENNFSPIMGGTFSDALNEARSKARLLVLLIPSASSTKNDKADYDAISSFLSKEVAIVAEGKAIKSKTKTKSSADAAQQAGLPEQKAFLLWSTKHDSTEATSALKRIKGIQMKNPNTGKKRPILAVIYPAGQINQVYPKLIAQHHCSPPPSATNMAGWLNTIRQRCYVRYNVMQTEIIELELYKQRQKGYVGSIVSDQRKQIQQAREEQERVERHRIEQEDKARILQRRNELKKSLGAEPMDDENDTTSEPIVTIALRITDSRISSGTTHRASKRRFYASTLLSDVFNWIDVEYEIEREQIELFYTSKGQVTSYQWDDNDNDDVRKHPDTKRSLSDLGFKKMVALRVVLKKGEDVKMVGNTTLKEQIL
jgi:hypothetical protein